MEHNALRGKKMQTFLMLKNRYIRGSALFSVQCMTVASLLFVFGSIVEFTGGSCPPRGVQGKFFYKTNKYT